MSDIKPLQQGSVLSNLNNPPNPPSAASPTSSSGLRRLSSPDEVKGLNLTTIGNQSNEALVSVNGTKIGSSRKLIEPEIKKRKRSQRACVRCRGQKLKCDGVFPCARCLKLKLVCKEPTDPSSGLAANGKDEQTHSSSIGRSAPSHSPRHPHQAAQNLYHARMMASPSIPSQLPGNTHIHASAGSSGNGLHGHYHHMSHGGLRHPSPSWMSFSPSDTTKRIERLEATVSRLVHRVERPGEVRLAPEHARAARMPYATTLREMGDSVKVLDNRPFNGKSATLGSRDHLHFTRATTPAGSELEIDELAHDGHSDASPVAGESRFPDHRTHALYTLSKLSTETWPATYSAAHDDATMEQGRPRKEVYDPTKEGREVESRRSDAAGKSIWRTDGRGRAQSILLDPVESGIVHPAKAQELLQLFFDRCQAYVPFFDADSLPTSYLLRKTEPFLLSTILAIATRFPDVTLGKNSAKSALMTEDLCALAEAHLAQTLTRSRHRLGDVQAILLLRAWGLGSGQDGPDSLVLSSHAFCLAEKLGLDKSLLTIDATPPPASDVARRSWTVLCVSDLLPFPMDRRPTASHGQLRACFDALTSVRKYSSRAKFAASDAFLAVQCELAQISYQLLDWVNELVSPGYDPARQANRWRGRTLIWERYKAIESQLYMCHERWGSAPGGLRTREEVTSAASNRWHLQLCLSILALRLNEMAAAERETGGSDGRRMEEDEAHRFYVAYYRSAKQAAQSVIELYSSTQASFGLASQPDHLVTTLAQAVLVLIGLISIDEGAGDWDRISTNLIHLGLDKLTRLDASTGSRPGGLYAFLARVVKQAYTTKLQVNRMASSDRSSQAGSNGEWRMSIHSPTSSTIQPAYLLQVRDPAALVNQDDEDAARMARDNEDARGNAAYGRPSPPVQFGSGYGGIRDAGRDVDDPLLLLFGPRLSEEITRTLATR